MIFNNEKVAWPFRQSLLSQPFPIRGGRRVVARIGLLALVSGDDRMWTVYKVFGQMAPRGEKGAVWTSYRSLILWVNISQKGRLTFICRFLNIIWFLIYKMFMFTSCRVLSAIENCFSIITIWHFHDRGNSKFRGKCPLELSAVQTHVSSFAQKQDRKSNNIPPSNNVFIFPGIITSPQDFFFFFLKSDKY